MAYERPQVTVDQNMTITPTSLERDQPAFVFGPQYELRRYDNADEKEDTAVSEQYTGASMTTPYPNVIKDSAVDQSYTKLIGDNVVVKLADLGAASLPEVNVPAATRYENGGFTKLLFADKVFVNYDSYAEAKVTRSDITESEGTIQLPRNIVVGDTVRVSYKDGTATETTTINTTVSAIEYRSHGWSIDSDSSSECAAGTLITLYDALPETVNVASVTVELVAVVDGVEFARKNLRAGTGYQWEQGEYTVDEDTFYGVRVNALNALISGFFTAEQLKTYPTLNYRTVLVADLFITYRELVTTYSDTFHSLIGASAVEGVLGTVHPDNPLAMGVYMASLNAATDDGDEAPPVYFMATPSDDITGYRAVLRKATVTDKAYVFAPTTQDETVIEETRNHVEEMSAKAVKMWRIGAVSAEIPNEVCKLNALMDPQGDEFLAIPVSKSGITPGLTDGYTMFRVVKSATDVSGNPDTKFGTTIAAGDTVRFCYRKNNWLEQVYDEYTVKEVKNNYTLVVTSKIDVSKLTGAATDPNYTPEKIEVYHPYTAAESADLIASTSKELASRRVLNVFPSVFGMDGVTMTGEFAACAVAGLVSATEPQQPITNVTVRGIDDVPLTYQTYSKTELDTIAAGGTFIVAQDLPSDIVYVRHQITTAYPDGNLNTAELSITKNVDSISYTFADAFKPYYGKYNITPELIAALENLTTKVIGQLGKSTSVYGPQLIADETVIKYIKQNELVKDHLDVAITLGVPYPCNNIDIVLTV